jgi:hypothetical protein
MNKGFQQILKNESRKNKNQIHIIYLIKNKFLNALK